MNSALQQAWDELIEAGAEGLPDPTSVEQGPDGKTWIGKKKDGSSWVLKKHRPDSYSCTC